MFYWDLDGVLRATVLAVLENYPDRWGTVVNGKNYVDFMNENLELLLKAPKTEYFEIARKYEPVHIVTVQPEPWKPYTYLWLDRTGLDYRIHCVDTFKEKLAFLKNGDYLIEDYPYFKDYSRIILIDRPYNRKTKAKWRVSRPEELERILSEMSKRG